MQQSRLQFATQVLQLTFFRRQTFLPLGSLRGQFGAGLFDIRRLTGAKLLDLGQQTSPFHSEFFLNPPHRLAMDLAFAAQLLLFDIALLFPFGSFIDECLPLDVQILTELTAQATAFRFLIAPHLPHEALMFLALLLHDRGQFAAFRFEQRL